MWLLTQSCFNFAQNIYQKLVTFAAKRIDFHLLDTTAVEEMYPAMNINDPLLKADTLKLKFLKDVLEKCHCVSALYIKSGEEEKCDYEQADKVLGLMSSNFLSKLTCLSITGKYPTPSIHADPLAILIGFADLKDFTKYLNILLPKYNLLKMNPQVHAHVECHEPHHDLSTLITKHIKWLHLDATYKSLPFPQFTLFVSSTFPHCPQLTHFAMNHCHIDDSVPFALMKGVENGELPNLQRIELVYCTVTDCDWPAVPELSFETREKLNSSQVQKLLSKLTELTFRIYIDQLSDTDLVIPVCLEKLSVLMVDGMESHNLQKLNDILKKRKTAKFD